MFFNHLFFRCGSCLIGCICSIGINNCGRSCIEKTISILIIIKSWWLMASKILVINLIKSIDRFPSARLLHFNFFCAVNHYNNNNKIQQQKINKLILSVTATKFARVDLSQSHILFIDSIKILYRHRSKQEHCWGVLLRIYFYPMANPIYRINIYFSLSHKKVHINNNKNTSFNSADEDSKVNRSNNPNRSRWKWKQIWVHD